MPRSWPIGAAASRCRLLNRDQNYRQTISILAEFWRPKSFISRRSAIVVSEPMGDVRRQIRARSTEPRAKSILALCTLPSALNSFAGDPAPGRNVLDFVDCYKISLAE